MSEDDARIAISRAVEQAFQKALGPPRLEDLLEWAAERDIISLSFDPETQILNAVALARREIFYPIISFSVKV